jgi:hypothetical protein
MSWQELVIMIDRAAVQRMVFECFDRLVRIDEDQERKINYLTDDICKRNIDLRSLDRILNRHLEISKYTPKLADIYSIQRQLVTEHHHNRIIEFLNRFKSQATNKRGMDNDVYTIKQCIGDLKVENTSIDKWQWVDNQARELYIDFLQGKIKLEKSPVPVEQKLLKESKKVDRVDKTYFDDFFKNATSVLLGNKS